MKIDANFGKLFKKQVLKLNFWYLPYIFNHFLLDMFFKESGRYFSILVLC